MVLFLLVDYTCEGNFCLSFHPQEAINTGIPHNAVRLAVKENINTPARLTVEGISLRQIPSVQQLRQSSLHN